MMCRELHERDGRDGRVTEVEMLAECVVERHFTAFDRDGEQFAGEHLRDRADLEGGGFLGVHEGGVHVIAVDDGDRGALPVLGEGRLDVLEERGIAGRLYGLGLVYRRTRRASHSQSRSRGARPDTTRRAVRPCSDATPVRNPRHYCLTRSVASMPAGEPSESSRRLSG